MINKFDIIVTLLYHINIVIARFISLLKINTHLNGVEACCLSWGVIILKIILDVFTFKILGVIYKKFINFFDMC